MKAGKSYYISIFIRELLVRIIWIFKVTSAMPFAV